MKNTLLMLVMAFSLMGCESFFKPRVEYIPITVIPVFPEEALQECEKMGKLEDKTGAAMTMLLIDTKFKLAKCANEHKTLVDVIRGVQKETEEQNKAAKARGK